LWSGECETSGQGTHEQLLEQDEIDPDIIQWNSTADVRRSAIVWVADVRRTSSSPSLQRFKGVGASSGRLAGFAGSPLRHASSVMYRRLLILALPLLAAAAAIDQQPFGASFVSERVEIDDCGS